MNINIKKSSDIVGAIDEYAESKLAPLAKFIKHFDETGEAEMWLEVSRTSDHHKKGDVFKASIDLRLPKKSLHADAYEEDIHTAIDHARDILRLEIDKYKTQFVELHKKKLGNNDDADIAL